MITEDAARKQLETLHQEGSALVKAFAESEDEDGSFEIGYQRWYSRALPLMKQVAPERHAEFKGYYESERDFSWYREGNYVIKHYFLHKGFDDSDLVCSEEVVRCFNSQLAILKSVVDRLEWMALDTEDQASRGFLLAELEAARGLIKISERAAGVVAGLVLESYLRKLAAKRQVKLRKQAPATGELVEALKEAKVLDVPVWSQATWLVEIHGRCFKSEGEAPTKLQVRDLVDGTHWLLTNVF